METRIDGLGQMPLRSLNLTSFDRLYDSLTEDAGTYATGVSPSGAVPPQWPPLETLCPDSPGPPCGTSGQIYLESALDHDGPAAMSIDLTQITSELGLHPDMSIDDIARIRRQFASRNHPDRVPAELRKIATIRMQVANALLDRLMGDLNDRDRSAGKKSCP